MQDYDNIMDRRMEAAERDSEKRQEAIESMADYLMDKGNEFDPFRPDNLSEAMGNLPDNVIAGISRALYVGQGFSLARVIAEYWRPSALKEAERRVDLEA